MGLDIDITKQLPGFALRAQLGCEQGIIGVLGASGAGKSMLLKCIAGLVSPDRGRILIDGVTFFDSGRKINLPSRERKTGFLFQNYALFPHLTIAENIAFGLDKLNKTDRGKRVSELMERFKLAEMAARYPSQISGGQQQRVALARALAAEPKILLLDEPFSALDNHLKNHMMKDMLVFLKEFGGSTLFVTHNIEEAYRLCDLIAVLNSGKVEFIGPKEEVFMKPASLAAAQITGCKNIAGAVRISSHMARIPEWGITLSTADSIEDEQGFIGIRANHIMMANDKSKENLFSVWIADESKAQFRTTLYLKIGSVSVNPDDYHIEWEISREQRDEIMNLGQPFHICLRPERIFFVRD
ncbi:MAG TPA: sulfate/molybdate ABC transporter ATP-binding protein [Syntrophomonas sp.]|nr:sulfate/molybdate ABC transporter ATP-binding protein [Syntrophomonas sp.]